MVTSTWTAALALAPLGALVLALQGPSSYIEALDGSRTEIVATSIQDDSWGKDTAVINMHWSYSQLQRWGAGAFEVTLHSGDRVLGTMSGGDEESLGMELIGSASTSFSIEEINHLVALENLADQSALIGPKTGDRLWRITPGGFDPLDGFLIGFDNGGVTMEGELGTRTTPWDEVASLWIEALDEVPAAERIEDEKGRPPVSVDLVDGSRLRGHFGGVGERGLHLARAGGQAINLGLDTVMKISLDDTRQTYLSDRKWLEQAPLSLFGDEYGMRWPTLADRAVTGDNLRSGGLIFSRGLGVHAPSTVQFNSLDGGILRGSVALDDSILSVPAKGSVTFHILLDGEQVWESPEMTAGDTPIALPGIPVGNAKLLELRVDEASDSFVGDRANWLDIRIVKP